MQPAARGSWQQMLPMSPLAVAVPLIGGLVIVLALAALIVWYRFYRLRGEPPPPELNDEEPGLPPDRDDTWDPRRRQQDT